MADGRKLLFTNSYMFGRVMLDESICADFIEAALGVHVTNIEYTNVEQVMQPTVDGKGARIDLFAEADGRMFDIEMQARRELELGRRMRYYQACIDSRHLDKGADYDQLPESHIVFLCAGDPFGEGRPAYHIDRQCRESPSLNVKCGANWLALNARAWTELPEGDLRSLLQYVRSGVPDGNGLVERIDAAVEKANGDTKWVRDVFSVSTVEENAERRVRIAERYYRKEGVAEGREIGIAEGRAQGRAEGAEQADARYSALIETLLDAGRTDDLRRAACETDYRQQLYTELGI